MANYWEDLYIDLLLHCLRNSRVHRGSFFFNELPFWILICLLILLYLFVLYKANAA